MCPPNFAHLLFSQSLLIRHWKWFSFSAKLSLHLSNTSRLISMHLSWCRSTQHLYSVSVQNGVQCICMCVFGRGWRLLFTSWTPDWILKNVPLFALGKGRQFGRGWASTTRYCRHSTTRFFFPLAQKPSRDSAETTRRWFSRQYATSSFESDRFDWTRGTSVTDEL